MAASSSVATPMRSAASAMVLRGRVTRGCLVDEKGGEEQAEAHAADGADEAGQHERVVQQIFADTRGAGTVELHRGDERAVVRNEEVAIHRRKHADEVGGRDA